MSIRLLTVLAHPDDETVVSGMLARYASNGSYVVLCSTTRGEVGEISDKLLATRESLGDVRSAELETAAHLLGLQEIRFLGYRDSGMEGTPENQDPRAFAQADSDEATGRIVALIREVRPHVVVTFEPGGWYGHPDHVTASRLTTAAYDAAGADVYPEAGPPWQPQRLFYAVTSMDGWRELYAHMKAAGMDTSSFDDFDLERDNPSEEQVTHVLDVGPELALKRQAMAAHRTQFSADSPLGQMSDEMLLTVFGREHYIQVRPSLALAKGDTIIDDLCAGVQETP